MKFKALAEYNAACAPLALQYCSGAPTPKVLSVCRFYGWTETHGIADWRGAAKSLGLRLCTVVADGEFPRVTLAKFTRLHPRGLYLVAVREHLLVVDDGEIVDSLGRRARRYVEEACEVWPVGDCTCPRFTIGEWPIPSGDPDCPRHACEVPS